MCATYARAIRSVVKAPPLEYVCSRTLDLGRSTYRSSRAGAVRRRELAWLRRVESREAVVVTRICAGGGSFVSPEVYLVMWCGEASIQPSKRT